MNEPMTLREIGEAIGISHQCVHEILERALRKVSKRLQEQGIELSDLI